MLRICFVLQFFFCFFIYVGTIAFNHPAFGLAFKLSFLVYLILPIRFFFRKNNERYKRGALFLDEKTFKQKVAKYSRIHLSEYVSIPVSFEARHFFICGTVGTGKTTLISSVIDQVKQLHEKAVVYDAKDGELVSIFYNEQTDIIYNPLDARSVYLNIFDMIENDSDFDALAKSLVPETHVRERFFNDAARNIFAGILRYCHANGLTDNQHIWNILRLPVEQLRNKLSNINSEAVIYLSENQGGVTQSIMSSLIRYAKIFRYLQNPGKKESFSLRNWVNSPGKGTIFLTNNTKQRESLRGILSLFINSLADNILSLRDDPQRRIFIIVDEFGTLQRMDSVKELLSLGRSKGCSFWIGVQEKAQIDDIYGRSISNSIINQCNTHIIFRMNDSDSAEYFSRVFGERESILTEHTHSQQGGSSHRGTSYRDITKREHLILPSELQTLPDFKCYVKMHSFPIVKTTLVYKSYDTISDSFVPDKAFELSGKNDMENNANEPEEQESNTSEEKEPPGDDEDKSQNNDSTRKEEKKKKNKNNKQQLGDDFFNIGDM